LTKITASITAIPAGEFCVMQNGGLYYVQ